MKEIISIHDREHEIDLKIGKYKIDVVGGWGVKLGQFSISFKHKLTGQVVNCERPFWPVQSFAFGRRTKRIFIAHITNPGTYVIEFKHPDTLIIKEANLFFAGFFQQPLPNERISIYIH